MHKLTTQFVQRSKPIHLENLHRKGILQNRHLSRVFKNQSFLNFNGNENITLHSMVGSLLFLIIIIPAVKIFHQYGCKAEPLHFISVGDMLS
ncbi:hypothetical protein [Bartonella quintana]|uniref:hypothetical protein n=1 Tax=Bartonella quintana TaxID=803 RepID=UPI0004AD205F|nr:hypothetical protein [Bartonella quintana]QUG72077.1 hypothetical protein FOL54_03210 [Bartonella quintana]